MRILYQVLLPIEGERVSGENKFSMTVPVTIKHEKGTEAGPSCFKNLRPFSKEPISLPIRAGEAGSSLVES